MKPIPRPPTPRRVPRRMVKTLHARAAASEKDFEEYEGESEPNMKFSHALIVVLVLHILAVGGVFAFNALKGRHGAPEHAKPAAAEQPATATPDVVTASAAKTAAQAHESPAALSAPAKAPAKSQPESASATYTVVAGDTLTRIATGHKTTVEAIEQANGIGSNSALRIGQVLKIPARPGTAPARQETPAAKTAEAKAAPVAKSPEVKAAPAPKTSEAKTAPAVKSPDAKPTPVVKTVEASAPPKPAVSEAPKPSAADKSYTVAKGDNPYSIAKKLKVSYSELIKANNIQDPTKLQIGQKLIVP
ncbi:MAG: LysM peptidoglycan-binding domain-containing protein [Verrucomicrobia bacterium]|nr:LysM peptidoglycan-binding domain-containing protein [Verrucomicrobiota bacterium]